MSEDNIEEMTDEELSRAVAEEVMGCRVARRRGRRVTYDLIVPGGVTQISYLDREGAWRAVPKYSTYIGAAWQVVERFPQYSVSRNSCGFNVAFVAYELPDIKHGIADTPSRAICIAALRAKRSRPTPNPASRDAGAR